MIEKVLGTAALAAHLVTSSVGMACDADAKIGSDACEAAKGISEVSADIVTKLADRERRRE